MHFSTIVRKEFNKDFGSPSYTNLCENKIFASIALHNVKCSGKEFNKNLRFLTNLIFLRQC